MSPKSTLAVLSLVTVSTLGITQHGALTFDLFSTHAWIDIPMHFLGGVAVAFGFLFFTYLFPRVLSRYRSVFFTLASVLAVSLVWEIFEIYIGIPLLEEGFGMDLIKDLCFDMVGGYIGIIIGKNVAQARI